MGIKDIQFVIDIHGLGIAASNEEEAINQIVTFLKTGLRFILFGNQTELFNFEDKTDDIEIFLKKMRGD